VQFRELVIAFIPLRKKFALSRVGDGGRDVGFDSAPMPIHT